MANNQERTDLVGLGDGDVIQRGDLFLDADGTTYHEIDNAGRLLGVRVTGQVLRKGGIWFRPEQPGPLHSAFVQLQEKDGVKWPCFACRFLHEWTEDNCRARCKDFPGKK